MVRRRLLHDSHFRLIFSDDIQMQTREQIKIGDAYRIRFPAGNLNKYQLSIPSKHIRFSLTYHVPSYTSLDVRIHLRHSFPLSFYLTSSTCLHHFPLSLSLYLAPSSSPLWPLLLSRFETFTKQLPKWPGNSQMNPRKTKNLVNWCWKLLLEMMTDSCL